MTISKQTELKLNKRGQGYAKIYSSLLKDEFQRKRSYACLSALYAFLDFVESTEHRFTVQKAMTLFRNPAINEEFEITDLYLNGKYIDFRVFVDGDAVLLPKAHVDNGILPDYYAVVKTDKNLTSFTLEGFIETENMKAESFDYYYNSVSLSQLISYEEFVAKIEKAVPAEFDASEHDIFTEDYLRLTDNEIDKDTKRDLIRHLLQCEDCRREFCCFTGFEMVSINTGKYPELTEDKTLDIIAAQAVEKGEYQGKEEIIRIDNDGTEETPVENDIQDVLPVVNDNLPENKEESANDYEIIEEEPETDNSAQNIAGTVAGAAGIAAAATGAAAAASGIAAAAASVTPAVNAEIIEPQAEPDILDQDINDILFPNVDENIVEDSAPDNSSDEILIDSGDEVEELVEDKVDADIESAENVENAPEPDILDELFTIDETLPENMYYEPSEVAKDDGLSGDGNGNNAEMILKIDEDDKNVQNDIEVEDSDVQKVIIDYDDSGDPVYSYVTNISDDENSAEENSDIDMDEEEDNQLLDDLDSEAASGKDVSYEDDNYVGESDELTEDISASAPDIVLDDDNDSETINDEDNDAAVSSALTGTSYLSSVNPADALTEPDVDESSDDDLLSTEDFSVDDADDDKQVSNSMYDSQVENFVNEEDNEEDNEFVSGFDSDDENDDAEDEEYDDDEEYGDDEEYADDEEEYDDEGEEDDEEDDSDESLDFIDENQSGVKKPKAAVAVIALILLLLLGGGGFGAYYFMNQNKNTVAVNKPVQNDMNTQTVVPNVTDENSGNDIMPAIEGTNDDMMPQNPEDNGNQQPEQQPEQPQNNDYQAPPLTENDLVPENAPLTQDPNKAITGAFSSNVPIVSLNGMNWKFKPELFTNQSFKDFLRNTDNNLKEKLKNNLMNVSEAAPNRSVAASIVVNNAGELVRSSINASSGSQQIDNIVLQSIKECFDGQKTVVIPEGTNTADKYNLIVVIKL